MQYSSLAMYPGRTLVPRSQKLDPMNLDAALHDFISKYFANVASTNQCCLIYKTVTITNVNSYPVTSNSLHQVLDSSLDSD